MDNYQQLQGSIDKAFAAHERDGAHLVLLPSIIYGAMITQLGIPEERLRMSAGCDTSTDQSIPPQPERGEISFDIIVTFQVKNNEPLSVTVPLSAVYDRYQYKIACGGQQFEVTNQSELDQEYLAKVVRKIGTELGVQVENFLTNK